MAAQNPYVFNVRDSPQWWSSVALQSNSVVDCRALEKDQAQLCILADDCNQADYKKLIEHLCTEKKVDLVRPSLGLCTVHHLSFHSTLCLCTQA